MIITFAYHWYKIVAFPTKVCVYDLRQPPLPGRSPIYRTTSVDNAKRWIDVYRKGQQWAVNEAHLCRHTGEPLGTAQMTHRKMSFIVRGFGAYYSRKSRSWEYVINDGRHDVIHSWPSLEALYNDKPWKDPHP